MSPSQLCNITNKLLIKHTNHEQNKGHAMSLQSDKMCRESKKSRKSIWRNLSCVVAMVIAATLWGRRDGTMVRALTSHQYGLGSIPRPGIMWVEFAVGSRPCSERFFSGYSGFPLS